MGTESSLRVVMERKGEGVSHLELHWCKVEIMEIMALPKLVAFVCCHNAPSNCIPIPPDNVITLFNLDQVLSWSRIIFV